jgi:SAM-dependent methyltransferase
MTHPTPAGPGAVCWCGNAALEPFSPEYSRCPGCETLLSAEMPGPGISHVSDEERGFYGREYWFSYQERDLGHPNILTRARTDLPERCLYWLRTALRYRVPPARVLELGSGHGGFVALLRAAGFDATGLEVSPWVVDFAAQTFGVPMLQGPVEEQRIAPGSLDMIGLMDVLEHLADPAGTIRRCLALLAPDGLLLIQTPCYPEGRGYAEMVAGNDRFLEVLQPKEHLHLLSRSAIREFFRRLGVEHVAFEPALFAEYDMFLVAGRAPLATRTPAEIAQALAASPSGRVIQALVDLGEGLDELKRRYAESERDRAARVEVIEEQGRRLGEVERERDELRLQNQARGDQVDALVQQLRALQELFARLEGTWTCRTMRRLGRWDFVERGVPDASPDASGPGEAERVARLIARRHAADTELFALWEAHGFHVVPVRGDSPIPQVSALPEALWAGPSSLPGVDLNEAGQLRFLEEVCPRYKAEYDTFGSAATGVAHEYHFDQMMFRSVDAEILHCMIRHERPQRIVQVGAGPSTGVAAAAAVRNAAEGHPVELTAIEPSPRQMLRDGMPGLTRLLVEPVQRVDRGLFDALGPGDILFIDSSHVLRIDSDVRLLLLDVVPRIAPGVLVHLHDIFLPLDYPREWVVEQHRFWTEQYLLQAFLTYNRAFEVVWAGSYMHLRHPDRLAAAFKSYDSAAVRPGSFWIRRLPEEGSQPRTRG